MAKISINLSTGSLQKDDIIVGIDLGTTNSLIAIIHPDTGQPTVLREHDASSLVPSLLHFDAAGRIQVGEEARPFLLSDPANTIFSVKRLMGKSYGDVVQGAKTAAYKIIDDGGEGLVKVEVAGKFYTPIELSSYILAALKKRAEHILKTPVYRAVVTVPAYFNDAQRQATRDAGRLAGLDVLRIVNEPTAASLAYGIGLRRDEEKTVAVYDLGGGTFDISILRIGDGVFDVLSTHGDTALGGDDMDAAIAAHWLESHPALPSADLRVWAEEAKKALTTGDTYAKTVDGIDLHLDRATFNRLIAPLLDKTLTHCTSALRDAGLSIGEIDEVLLVGGSTRVPLVKQRVGEAFGKTPNDSMNPDEVVALGAAIQADILAGNNRDLLLLDVTPLSLGIETMGGLMDVIIPRNSKVPSAAGRQYTTQRDGQTGIVVTVYQGERDLVGDNRKLGQFTLTGVPAMPAGMAKVDIRFSLNADGILTVSAKELRSGVAQSVEMKPQYGLTDAEVEKLLLNSLQNAQTDMALRSLIEARTEGEVLINSTESFLSKNPTLLTHTELTDTRAAVEVLRQAMAGSDKNGVQTAIEKLNEITRPFAERAMDDAVGKALSGQKI